MFENKIEFLREADFEKDKSFFLEYHRKNNLLNSYETHLLRPCNVTYDELTDDACKNKHYILDSALMAFKNDMPLIEVLFNCNLNGINVDFICIYDKVNEDKYRSWHAYAENKLIKVIDCHKEDFEKEFDIVDAPKFYIAHNKDKKDKFKFLVVDRMKQKFDLKTLRGEYDNDAIVAKMLDVKNAKSLCKILNK